MVLVVDSEHKIVRAIYKEAGACYAEPYDRYHIFILQEWKDTVIYEKPVLILRIYRVAKRSPDDENNHCARLAPKLFYIQLYFAERETQDAPAEQKSVIHKGLEYLVAEGRLTAERRSGIAHPHNSARNGEDNYGAFYWLEFRIELRKRAKYTHKRTDVEGKLVNGNTAITVRQRHNKEIGYVKANGEVCKKAQYLIL